MKRVLLVLLPLILLALPAKAQPSFELYDAYWLTRPAPGSVSVLVVRVKYLGPSGSVDVKASLLIEGVGGKDLTAEANYTGYLASGAILDLRFEVNVSEGALASYYPARMELVANGSASVIEFQVAFAGKPRFTVNADRSSLKKGFINKVKLSISVSEAPARNVAVRVSPASPFVTVIGGSLNRSGLIETGEELNLPLQVMVEDAASDSVALTVTISYEDYFQTPSTETITIGFEALKGEGQPIFRCVASPSRIKSGRPVEVAVYVSNEGSAKALDVGVALSSLSPGVAIISGSSTSLGDIAPGSSKVFKVILRADRTVTGVATLRLTISYYDEHGDKGLQTLEIGLEVARPNAPLLTVKPLNDTLPTGQSAKFVIEVINIGDAVALDVSVDLTSSSGIYAVGEPRVKLGRIAPGRSSLAVFRVRLSASGPVAATLRLKYYDESGYEYNDVLQVAVNGEPTGPRIVVTPLNASLQPNCVNRVLLLIENIGSVEAKNVTVTFTSQSPEIGAVVGSSTYYIGSLEPGDQAIAEFKVFIQPKVYGALQLLAAVEYSGSEGLPRRELMTLGFEVRGEWELSVAAVTTTPPVLFGGDKMVRVTVTLVNSGDYMAKDVRVNFLGGTWIKPATASGSTALIPYLPVGQAITVVFLANIDEETPPGNHELMINASGKILRFTLTVLEKAKFRAFNATSLTVERGGRGYRLAYVIENLSEATAEDVRVELFSPLLTGSTSTYLGTLSPHEKKIVVFEVDVDPATPPGVLTVELRISWTQEGRSLTQYLETFLVVKEPRGFNLLIVAAAVAIAATALVLYRSRRKILSKLGR